MSDNAASPCFTPGAMIATDKGLRAVETLEAGDRVLTADNGLQPIVWVGRRTLYREDLRHSDELQPILIRKDALGEGRPNKDLYVSPKHRFVVDWLKRDGRREEMLISADRLVDGHGIRPVRALGVSYFHLLFERHQVILANAAWTESFLPEPDVWQKIGAAQRCEIEALFPEVREEGIHVLADPARPLDRRPLWKRRMDELARRERPSVRG